MKQFIEMRGADGGPWRRLCALPAFWVGLMYDQSSPLRSEDDRLAMVEAVADGTIDIISSSRVWRD